MANCIVIWRQKDPRLNFRGNSQKREWDNANIPSAPINFCWKKIRKIKNKIDDYFHDLLPKAAFVFIVEIWSGLFKNHKYFIQFSSLYNSQKGSVVDFMVRGERANKNRRAF